MKNHTQKAIACLSDNAIQALKDLHSQLFEVSIGLDSDSIEFISVNGDLRRITQIIRQIEHLDVNCNPFGLSNFPFCNKSK